VNVPKPLQLGRAGWLAVGVCLSVGLLTWFGYRAVRGWQVSSNLLLEQRAGTATDLLASALTRDMHAVQRSVLGATDWDPVMDEAPTDLRSVVADAFAKYPYPEVFFAAHGALNPSDVLFFTRSTRRPGWAQPIDAGPPFPVAESTEPAIAADLIGRIRRHAASGRRYDIFETEIGGQRYQVITRLRYRRPIGGELEAVFGFLVNLEWARQHYFQTLTTQVASIRRPTTDGLALTIVDELQHVVAATAPQARTEVSSVRQFPLMFFDPILVAVGQSEELPRRDWKVEARGAEDAALAPAIQAADRTLVLTAFAAVSLAIGLVMTARAINTGARLTELRSEFVSSVTHELKTPISSIRAIGDTLASGRIQDPSEQREYAQLAVREAKRLARLVDNLLALSRITDVTEAYSFEPLELDALVARALQDFREQLRARRFETRVDISDDLPPILADQTAIGLLIDNLIDNSMQYSDTEREITISARVESPMVILRVADRGRGIAPDEISQVTRKFFRGSHFMANGSGLGLAIVKRIVDDHHGTLAITSTVDVGTTVDVGFPVADAYEQADLDS
jgi:signal transduction histidine kinase